MFSRILPFKCLLLAASLNPQAFNPWVQCWSPSAPSGSQQRILQRRRYAYVAVKHKVFPVKPFQAPKSACPKHTHTHTNSQQGKFSPLTSKQLIKTNRSAASWATPSTTAQTMYWSLKNIFSSNKLYRKKGEKEDTVNFLPIETFNPYKHSYPTFSG